MHNIFNLHVLVMHYVFSMFCKIHNAQLFIIPSVVHYVYYVLVLFFRDNRRFANRNVSAAARYDVNPGDVRIRSAFRRGRGARKCRSPALAGAPVDPCIGYDLNLLAGWYI